MVKEHFFKVNGFGPIVESNVTFGDLTVIVGPQASGKSIFLQTLKLAIDRNHIHETFSHHSMIFKDEPKAFMGAYFGRGMGELLGRGSGPTYQSSLLPTEEIKQIEALAKPYYGRGQKKGATRERLFYIPAQRVVSLPNGQTAPFGSFQYGDPYVLRYFADKIHLLLQNEFGSSKEIFPANNRLNENLRGPIERDFFAGAKIEIDRRDYTKSLSLKVGNLKQGLPYLAWSAGQREFAPLLFGLYWLCPAGATSIRDEIEWVVIEEPEMGLHPRAISSFLLLVLELMRRGYKVVLSTHSPVVLDLVWSIQILKEHRGTETDLRKIFELKANPNSKKLATKALEKEYRTFFFEHDGKTRDITSLDPSDENSDISSWGGLTGFAERSGDVIAEVVNRYSLENTK